MPPHPYNKLSTASLSTLLLARGLDPTGTKTQMLARLKKQDAEVEAADRATREGVRAASGAVEGVYGGAVENGQTRARDRVRGRRGRATMVDARCGMGGEREGEGKEIEGGGGERDVVKGLMPGGFEEVGGLGEQGIVVNESRAGGMRGGTGEVDGEGNRSARARRGGRGRGRGRERIARLEKDNGGATALEMAEWYLAMEKKRDEARQKMRFLMVEAGVVVGVLVLLVVVVLWIRGGR